MENKYCAPSIYPGIQSEPVTNYQPVVRESVPSQEDPVKFVPYVKTNRLSAETATISEKIDGTNGAIMVDKSHPYGLVSVSAGSRNRILSKDHDNHGFHAWMVENQEELSQLPHGIHYGEWYGKGIQHGYGMKDRKFMLFNRKRYEKLENLPKCLELETIIADNVEMFELMPTIEVLESRAKEKGSWHVPRVQVVEGIIIRLKLSAKVFKEVWHKGDVR